MFKCRPTVNARQHRQATLDDLIFYELIHECIKTESVHIELQHTTLLLKPIKK